MHVMCDVGINAEVATQPFINHIRQLTAPDVGGHRAGGEQRPAPPRRQPAGPVGRMGAAGRRDVGQPDAGPAPCIRQVAGSPLTVPTLPLRPASRGGAGCAGRASPDAARSRRGPCPAARRGPGERPRRRQPPGRCPVPDPAPGPVDRAGQVQRRPGHLRVGVPGSPEPSSAWTRHVRRVAAPPRAAAQASRARWPSVTGVPPQAPGNSAAFPCLLESGKGGTAPPRSPGTGQRQPFPMLPGPPGADRGPVHPDDGAPGTGCHWAPNGIRLSYFAVQVHQNPYAQLRSCCAIHLITTISRSPFEDLTRNNSTGSC